MKEFGFRLLEQLNVGLRADERVPRNSPGLVDCEGLKPIAGRLARNWNFIEPLDLSTIGLSFDWPFPQIIKGRKVTLLASKDRIFEISLETGLATEISVFEAENPSIAGSIVSGNIWHFIDAHTTWVLLNGECAVIRANLKEVDSSYDGKDLVSTTIKPLAGCYHRGRVILGGFRDNDDVKPYGVLSRNFVSWSSIGGGDSLFGFVNNIIPADNAVLLSRNDMGFMPMEWQGRIFILKPLGNNVIVYGENGISVMFLTGADMHTYGLRNLLFVGVAGRGAVAGDDDEHVFLDIRGNLWRLSSNLNLTRLGYYEFFEPVVARFIDGDLDEVIGAMNMRDREFYFFTDDSGFVLTEQGLGKMDRVLTSIVDEAGRVFSYGDNRLDTFAIETGDFDMGIRGIKFLQGVEVASEGISDVTVEIKTKFKEESFFTQSPKRGNDVGNVASSLSGVDFRILVKGKFVSEDAGIDYINARWKLTDKRFIRGLISDVSQISA